MLSREDQELLCRAGAGTPMGVGSVRLQDSAVIQSMGRIMDRSKEHLGTADAALIRVRRRPRPARAGCHPALRRFARALPSPLLHGRPRQGLALAGSDGRLAQRPHHPTPHRRLQQRHPPLRRRPRPPRLMAKR